MTKPKGCGTWYHVREVEYSVIYEGAACATWTPYPTKLRRREINRYVSNNIKHKDKRRQFDFKIF
jgi:hypothetical protein